MKLTVKLEKGLKCEVFTYDGFSDAKDFHELMTRAEDSLLTENFFNRNDIPVSNRKPDSQTPGAITKPVI